MRISEVLDSQSEGSPRWRRVVTVSATAGVRELLDLLAEHNVGALVVRASEDGAVEGIVSERDVVRRLREDEGVLGATVSTIMSAVVHTCSPSDSLDDLMGTMTTHRVRHVPVVDPADGGRLVGIVSIGDVVKSRIGQLEFERDQLDSYLHQS